MRTVHVLVQGTVQGVGFRYHCAYTAQELGVVGQVRNLPDGDVEVTAQGEPEAVGRLIAWLRRGPRWASVRTITVTDLPDDGLTPPSLIGSPGATAWEGPGTRSGWSLPDLRAGCLDERSFEITG